MPIVFVEGVYFTVEEAAARTVVPFGTMHRWAREAEQGITSTVEVRREEGKLYVSQASLRHLIAQEAEWAAKHDLLRVGRELAPSVASRQQLYASCFISYSTKDQTFADRLYSDLLLQGVSCWYAPHHAQGGRKLHEQIAREIDSHDRLLLILSEDSMNSEWVKTEIAHARQKELNENRRVLFPISLVPFETIKQWKNFDADTGKDSAREIREYFIPDFSDWKNHEAYRTAAERLLRDLKSEQPASAGASAAN